VPVSEVRLLDQLFENDQVRSNGLVHTLAHDGVGPVKLLGSLFKIDGSVAPPQQSIPALGEHTEEVMAECRQARA
jgi:crotonobetainyl-CoA:carnitine CoA-transferase CaiB-like acyl-CoA transferase